MNSLANLPGPAHARHFAAALLIACGLSPVRAAAPQVDTGGAPPAAPVADSRPTVAIAGFEADPEGDARDAWIPTALEELITWRLQRVPSLVVVPTIRLHQARNELAEPNAPPPPWPDVVRGLGADYLLRGRCRGPDSAVALDLECVVVRPAPSVAKSMSFAPARFLLVANDATEWVLELLRVGELPPPAHDAVLATPARTVTALEYHARGVQAARAGKTLDAKRYALQSLESDRRFRAALALLAQVELQAGPDGRESAARRFRALGDLARFENDAFDRVRAEIGQSLILQADGAFDAAYARAETALALAYESGDVYGQMAAIIAICDAFLLRPAPAQRNLTAEERTRWLARNARRAADWQHLLVDMLAARRDHLAGLPAASKLAVLYEQIDEPEAALAMHRRTLELAEALGSRPHQATAWLYLGQWYRKQQRWTEALDALTRCLALAPEASQPSVRIMLGGVYQALDLHGEALAQLEQAYQALRAGEDLFSQFICLREIAAVRWRLGQKPQAIAALQEAIDIAHALELREEAELRQELERWRQGAS